MTAPTLVLASTSAYRRELLRRLGLPFVSAAPQVDESRRPEETAEALVTRLAVAKAQSVGKDFPQALVIGSDQVACIEGEILGKPGGRERALAQLGRCSGKVVVFLTGLSLFNTATGRVQVTCEPFRVHFRALNSRQIAYYVDQERPFDCAGSFKSEGMGIALFERLEGDDPNALVGLPLIRLIAMLAAEGLEVLGAHSAKEPD